jgi:hypothetical protein
MYNLLMCWQPFTNDGVKSLRMILVLRCPTGAPEELKKLFRNGIAVLDGIRAADEVSEAERSQVRPFCTSQFHCLFQQP